MCVTNYVTNVGPVKFYACRYNSNRTVDKRQIVIAKPIFGGSLLCRLLFIVARHLRQAKHAKKQEFEHFNILARSAIAAFRRTESTE